MSKIRTCDGYGVLDACTISIPLYILAKQKAITHKDEEKLKVRKHVRNYSKKKKNDQFSHGVEW